MGRVLQTVLLVIESIITFFKLLPYFLWAYLNYRHLNYRISRNRKRVVKALKEEGLPEPIAEKIAEHFFPKVDFRLWQTLFPPSESMVEYFGKQDR